MQLKRLGIIGVMCAILLTGCAGTAEKATSTTSEQKESTTEVSEKNESTTELEESKFMEPALVSSEGDAWKKELTYAGVQVNVPEQGEKGNLQFKWAVAGNEVILSVEGLPDGMFLETISGNSEKILLLLGEGQAYMNKVYVCDLKNNSLTELIEGGIEQYSAYQVEASADLKHVILNTDEIDYYYDGKTVLNLAEACQVDDAESVHGTLVNDKILLSVQSEQKPDHTSFYVYDTQSKKANLVVEIETKINFENRDKGFQRYGDACATNIQDNKLVVWNLMTGTSYQTTLADADVKDILSVDEESLLVITEAGKLYLVDKNSGEETTVSEKPIDLSVAKSWGLCSDADGKVYLNVQEGEKEFAYYQIK